MSSRSITPANRSITPAKPTVYGPLRPLALPAEPLAPWLFYTSSPLPDEPEENPP